MTKRHFLIVMDDIKTINLQKDTTLAMMWAVQNRGHLLSYCNIGDLSLQNGALFINARSLKVDDKAAVLQAINAQLDKPFYQLGEKTRQPATAFDVILMRKDPPFEMNFLYALYLLNFAEQQGVLVVNKPQSVMVANEKLFAAQFAHLMTPTTVASEQGVLREFIHRHGDVIVKPLDGMGGMGIFRLTKDSPNIGATLEILTQNGSVPIMAQTFLPEIAKGDKRILIVGGKVVPYALARIPMTGETRGNLAAGGSGVPMALTDKEQQIADEIAPTLAARGLWFVGLDVIGDKITEINVTSPTGVRQLDDAFGLDIAGELVVFIEGRLAEQSE